MEVLFIVLNKEEHFEDLLVELTEHGIYGGTILESQGLAASFASQHSDLNYKYFRSILNKGRPYNKTLFLLLNDEKMEIAKECVRKVTGDIKQDNKGIMFTFPVTSVEGLTK